MFLLFKLFNDRVKVLQSLKSGFAELKIII